MPTYSVQAPDGKIYDIEGPEGATAAQLGEFISNNQKTAEPYDVPAGVKSLMNVGQGITFGFGDEIAGALGADKAKYRATLDQFKSEYPKSALLGQLSGSMLVPGGAGKLAAQAPWLTAATVGGVGGALQSAGDSENTANMIPDASKGLLTGAVAGPMLLGATKGTGSVFSALAPHIPFVSPESFARRQIVRGFERDNTTAEQVGAKMAELGPEARIADSAGESTRSMLNLNSYLPGKTANNLEELIRNRIANRPDRMDSVVDSVSNGMGRAKSLVNALTDQQRKIATPLYQKAHSQSIPADDDLISMLDAAKRLGAFGEAKTIATAERSPFTLDGMTSGQTTSSTNTLTNQVTTKTTGPSSLAIKDLDYVKRGLDSLIESNTNEFGKLNSKGVAFLKLKNELLAKVDALSPDFAAARQAFAGPESLKSAVNKGRAFWNEKADRLEDVVSGMTDSERQAFQVGAAEQLREMVGNQTGQNKLLNMWKDKNTREKLQALLGNDVKYSEVEKMISNEATLKRLEGLGPNRNSKTAQVEALGEDQSAQYLTDAAQLAKGNIAGPVTKFITQNASRLRTPEPVRDAIGSILMRQYAPPEIKALMDAEEAVRKARATAAAASGVVGSKATPGLLD